MRVYLNKIDGIADAITTMYMSKRSWSRDTELHIRDVCDKALTVDGFINTECSEEALIEFNEMFSKLIKWGVKHYTMLRFVDFSFTVEGLHRGAVDDFDSHSMRFNNRVIRSSTRLATFKEQEISTWYEDKILTDGKVNNLLNIQTPDVLEYNGFEWVKSTNGYVRSDLKDNKDVMRGLYMLSIPSNFIFKCNLTEFAHVVKERDINSSAAPELKECMELMIYQISKAQPLINRDLFYSIRN